MSPAQLLSAGLSRAPNARCASNKKPSKDQQIAALKDELRAAQERIANVSLFTSLCTHCNVLMTFQRHTNDRAVHNDQMQVSLDMGGDTDPATDPEETYATVGTKRKAGGVKKASVYVPGCSYRVSSLTVHR